MHNNCPHLHNLIQGYNEFPKDGCEDQYLMSKQEKKKRKTILGALFAREEPDEEYFPELKSQWEELQYKDPGLTCHFPCGCSIQNIS